MTLLLLLGQLVKSASSHPTRTVPPLCFLVAHVLIPPKLQVTATCQAWC